ncbi:RimK/LysX family protein [uncultured Ferrimonas sp.]|uniref:putative ATP-dependent zinc protease n=1 Tax=uncultured Ferrimonas sp. TaxID=432640 RepID=UPI00261ED4EB|nr:RimK/LysX family protein [uncultured Ferrimonas sp.]
MRRFLIALVASLMLSGCVSTSPAPGLSATELAAALNTHSNALSSQLQQQQAQQAKQQAQQQQQLRQQVTALAAQLAKLQPAQPESIPTCEPVVINSSTDKMVFGAAEKVTAPDFNRQFDARVDTGAASTSMGILKPVLFERNGEDWVQFELPNKEASPTQFEAKVDHFVAIKKASANQTERRPVIKVRLQIGTYNGETEVNLTNRSHMEYPLLLGRKFFKDIAVVDVSKQYVQSQ